MNLWESLAVAMEGLAANKLRSALTMLGVIIGVSSVITMLAIAQGARERMMSRIRQMGTNVLIVFSGQSRRGGMMGGFGSVQSLTLDDAEAIPKRCPSVARATAEVSGSARVKYRNQNTVTSILGTTPDYLLVRNYHVEAGKFFTARDVHSLRKVAVIGPVTAQNLFGEASPVGKSIAIKQMRFTIIGLMASKGAAGGFGDPDDQIFIPITTAMRRVFGVQYVRVISAEARSLALMPQATTEMTSALRKRHRLQEGADDDFIVRNQAEVMQMANEASGVFALLLGGIASVSLLVGGIGIMNIMLVSVTERTREIGIRMAIGARRRDIQTQFLVEALTLSLVGGAVGVVVGILGAAILARTSEWSISVSLPSIALSFGFAALIGIFFGFYPARKASQLDPIEALRYE